MVASAEEVLRDPLWEAGFVTAAFSGPSYPAADDETAAAFLSPYIIYRGDVFSVGDEGALRALAFANDTLELDLSLGASLPANSEDDADREGMEDLDFLFEIGPQLIWHAGQNTFKNWQGIFDIKLRARSVISLADFDSRGYLFEPSFVYELKSKARRNLSWQADVEMLFGNDRLNRYFYQVGDMAATDTRPQYDAEAGYMGTEIGARNLADQNRYNALPAVAEVLGLDTRSDRTLWRDRALMELNRAVLHSFDLAGITIGDHHTLGEQFEAFCTAESRKGKQVKGDWSWLSPPMSAAQTTQFHREFDNDVVQHTNFFYQDSEGTEEKIGSGCPFHL